MTVGEIVLASTHSGHEVSNGCVLSPFIHSELDSGLRTQARDTEWHGGARDKLKMLHMSALSSLLFRSSWLFTSEFEAAIARTCIAFSLCVSWSSSSVAECPAL